MAASASVKFRNSFAFPTFQPAFSSRFLLSFFMYRRLPNYNSRIPLEFVVSLDPFFASVYDRLRRLFILLVKHLQDHDRVAINPIYDSPREILIVHTQLMAPSSD